jgi:hypothetical protein
MKFCQTDGTVLIDDAPPAADPYKTVVGNQSEIASAIPPLDPFKTMVANPPKAVEEDLLQLPDEQNSLKTVIVSQDELRGGLKASEADDVPKLDLPPSAPLIEPKPASQSDFAPAPPRFDEPFSSSPNFGDVSSSESGLPKPSETNTGDATAIINLNSPPDNAPSPFDSKPLPNDFSTQSPYGSQENKPIPSPFQDAMPPSYQPPSASPFDAPTPPPFKKVEPMFGGGQESANQSPFQPPSPFGTAEPFNSQMQQTEWSPPPAPVSEWQNQDLGANTPFQPPPAASGQDQTLAIVSLVCGILGILCCGLFTGIPALITGYMAKNNVDSNPNQYGGRGLAVAGMIMGGISILFSILGIIYYIILLATSTF